METRIIKGDHFEYIFSFSQNDVINFANASGDFNPIHLEKEFGEQSIFKRTIIHGFLGASVFSKVFGTIFPGNGTIYLKQDLKFLNPMFVNTTYKSVFHIIETDILKNRALVKTEIFDSEDKLIITGEALIKHPSIY
jgi:3-hydroxybutyryl-CoA dehydratase